MLMFESLIVFVVSERVLVCFRDSLVTLGKLESEDSR